MGMFTTVRTGDQYTDCQIKLGFCRDLCFIYGEGDLIEESEGASDVYIGMSSIERGEVVIHSESHLVVLVDGVVKEVLLVWDHLGNQVGDQTEVFIKRERELRDKWFKGRTSPEELVWVIVQKNPYERQSLEKAILELFLSPDEALERLNNLVPEVRKTYEVKKLLCRFTVDD